MDDQAALLARRVALAASAWLKVPTDARAYAYLVDAVSHWNSYQAPALDDVRTDEPELPDSLVDGDLPQPLGEGLAGLESALRAAARKSV